MDDYGYPVYCPKCAAEKWDSPLVLRHYGSAFRDERVSVTGLISLPSKPQGWHEERAELRCLECGWSTTHYAVRPPTEADPHIRLRIVAAPPEVELATLQAMVTRLLQIDGAHHKQWVAEQIADKLGLDLTQIAHVRGIAP